MIGYPFDSHVTFEEDGTPVYDRAVSSAPLRKLYKKLFSDGVLPNPSTNMQVSAGDGMNVLVHPGFAMCNGCLKLEESQRTLAVQAANANYDRIDTVVLRLNDNDSERICDFYVLEGVPATSPVRPTLTRNESVWELGLADLYIVKGTTAVSNQRITDTRYETARCGIISSISKFDTTTLYRQVQEDLNAFQKEEQADFLAWFENIKNQLSEDAAGNLQLQIEGVHHVLHSDDLYSDQRKYVVGDYCIKDNILYRFSANKNAGEWDETRVTKSSVVDELNRKWKSLGVISKDSSDKKIIFPMDLSLFNELAIVCRMHPFPWMNMIIPKAKAGLHLASYQYSEKYHQSIGIEVADRNVSVNSSWTTGNYDGTTLNSSVVEMEVYYR